jgi:hypothetical protein
MAWIAGGNGYYRNLPVLEQTSTAFARLACFNGLVPSLPANNNKAKARWRFDRAIAL